MKKNNPACYECPKKRNNGLHRWQRQPDKTAVCLNCGLRLTVEEADDCFEDRS